MSRPLRLALVVVGLAMAGYASVSVTSPQLGPPPWSQRAATDDEVRWKWMGPEGFRGSLAEYRERFHPTMSRPTWEWMLISAAVVAVGLALAAVGAWPRRRTAPSDGA